MKLKKKNEVENKVRKKINSSFVTSSVCSRLQTRPTSSFVTSSVRSRLQTCPTSSVCSRQQTRPNSSFVTSSVRSRLQTRPTSSVGSRLQTFCLNVHLRQFRIRELSKRHTTIRCEHNSMIRGNGRNWAKVSGKVFKPRLPHHVSFTI